MPQEFIDIEKVDLLNKTLDMKNDGYRLAQICALMDMTLMYSFVKDEDLITLRFNAGHPEPVESISCLYPFAYIYENEMKDLFGINIVNINLDFKGNFYQTAVKTPFRESLESDVKDFE